MPLTLVIIWGAITGSPLPPITANELRTHNIWQIFLKQAASGSVSGAFTGAFIAALYSSIIPIYPVSYPIVGWIAGYFSLRSLQKQSFICIPLVFLLTGIAESIMSWQLTLSGRIGVYDHLFSIVLPEALLNSIIAPFVYFPIKQWLEAKQNRMA
jgi:rod shape-determining protein MreD